MLCKLLGNDTSNRLQAVNVEHRPSSVSILQENHRNLCCLCCVQYEEEEQVARRKTVKECTNDCCN